MPAVHSYLSPSSLTSLLPEPTPIFSSRFQICDATFGGRAGDYDDEPFLAPLAARGLYWDVNGRLPAAKPPHCRLKVVG